MSDADIAYLTAEELLALYGRHELSPVEVVEVLLERIEGIDPQINSFCYVDADGARQHAKAAERLYMQGQEGNTPPLCGVPVGIKDTMMTAGLPTARGSRIYADVVPEEDSPAVTHLRDAGAVLIGKTTTPEFGWKGVTDSPLTGVTRNPWNLEMTPGGSSGGSAAAVAAGLVPMATGTDAGGSIRGPASFTGIVGLKPTFGRVPQYPPSPLQLLSHAGPMTRTVGDAALMLSAIARPDGLDRDPVALPADPVDYVAHCKLGGSGLRLAWSSDLGYAKVRPDVRETVGNAVGAFEDLGATVKSVDMNLDDPLDHWNILWYAAAAYTVSTFSSSECELLDPGYLEIAELGQKITGKEISAAWMEANRVWLELGRVMEGFDLLLTPTMSVTAFPVATEVPLTPEGDTGERDWESAFSYPFNLSRHPAISVPCGLAENGLPVGLQIIGRRFEEAVVLRAAAAFENGQESSIGEAPPGVASLLPGP